MRRVALLDVGAAAQAAWQWLAGLEGATAVHVRLSELAPRLARTDVLWIHATEEPPPLPGESLMAWVSTGGRVLLTQRATQRVVALGLERDGPNDCTPSTWAHAGDELWFLEFRSFRAFPHIRGLAAYGAHPLFAGLHQGTYVWAPTEGEPYVRAVYARGKRPAHGQVVACERSYLHLNPERAVAWEYAVGQGGVLCVGAFVVPEARDPLLARQLRAVLRNALLGSGIPHATRTEPAAHWPDPGERCRPDPSLALPGVPSLDGALPGLDSPLHMSTRALADDPYTLAGRRALAVGGEQAGLREIWLHPWRVLKGMAVSVGGETPLIRDVQITPALIQRHLVSKYRIVEETVATALEHPIVLLEYRAEKIGRARNVRTAAEVTLHWTVDLRRTWPYPAAAGGDLRYHAAPDGRSLVLADAAGSAWAGVLASRPVSWELEPVRELVALDCRLSTSLVEPVRLAFVAGGSRAELEAVVGALARRGVTGLARQRVRHAGQVSEQLVRLHSPDPQVDAAMEWAKVRLDSFLLDVPGVGRSLAAGHAAARPGWGDGRPGYAWFFGRDACWTAFALLAAGDFSGARLVLRFLGDTQDVSGKVIHEYTTSGLAHYDAADSTPLYLLLAGRYAAWTGELGDLGEIWDRVERAYRFCLETDSDGDGLIENTRVGHGWIEMGPLAGSHVTLYLAAIWIAALESLAPVARALGKGAFADELVERAGRARREVARRFRTGDGYALGLLADGTPQRHRTALTAVALLLRAVDPAPATAWLDAITSEEFTAPWGVRLVSHRHPIYNPAGYHTGAVWPLYTGWVSLAEYACHRSEAGFEHLLANARLPFAREQGAFDEVLHGEAEKSAGVCPDQAWSAAMLVLPVVEGMLGAQPNALEQRLLVAPHLPSQWGRCEWRGLHVGQTTLDVRVVARADRVLVRLRRTAGPPLEVAVAPALPPGRRASGASVDGEPLTPRETEQQGCRHAELRLEARGEHEAEVWCGER